MMRYRPAILMTFVLLMVCPVLAQPDKDRTELVREHLLRAYQQTQTYQAKVEITVRRKEGRIRQSMDYRIAYDREANRLQVDRPDTLLVADGSKLYFKADQLPGHHLEMPSPPRLDYQALEAIGPILGNSDLPDLALLLAADPWEVLGEGNPVIFSLESSRADAADKILRLTLSNGRIWWLHMDPTTHLLTQAVLVIDDQALGQPGLGRMEVAFVFAVEKHNQPLDLTLFAFDTRGSRAASSLQTMVQAAASSEASGSGESGEGEHWTIDRPAPPVELLTLEGKLFDLAKEPARVVVLDFWASWCGPCRVGLPMLDQIHLWAKTQGKSVAVYAVNLQESPETIQAFLNQVKLQIPVLRDVDGQAARAFGVGAIPHTTLMVDGVVQAVHVGIPPTPEARQQFLENFKQAIQDHLDKPPATAPQP